MSSERSKNKIQNVLTLKHSYIYFTKDLPEDSKYNLSYKQYRAICEDFNKLVSQAIIEEGFFFKMPYRLGTIRIKKHKILFSNLKPNFGLFNESEGKYKNVHLNEHSSGYYVRFYWNKMKETIIRNKTAYSFIATRANKRETARVIKSDKYQINKYFE